MDDLKESTGELLKKEKARYDAKRMECAAAGNESPKCIDLSMRIRIVDGDAVLADTDGDGSFESTCEKFKSYVKERFGKDE